MTEPTTSPDTVKNVLLKRDLPAPSFSVLTDPTWVSLEEKQRRYGARSGGGLLGGGLGVAGGALLGEHFGGPRGAAIGGLLGGLAGYDAGRNLAGAHNDHLTVKRDQAVADRERAQEHRKELLDVKETKKKEASMLNGAMYAAMAHELASMEQEKVAINLGAVGSALGGLASRAATAAPRVMGALENVGGRLVGGVQAGARGLAARSTQGSAITNAAGSVLGGINHASGAVGGAQNLNRLVGAGAAGVAGVGALGVGATAMRRPKPTTTINVQR